MSIRIGIYDFFAYTLPGIFYILVVIYGLTVFGFIAVDLSRLNNISLSSFLALIGTGYFVGLLLDRIAYKWVTLYIGGNGRATHYAFDVFHAQHPWLELNFEVADWSLLLQAIKKKSNEGIMDIEMHNVTNIMLRNISLGLMMVSAIYILFFIFISPNLWNLVLAVIAIVFSGIAIERCALRRHWFYIGVFEAFIAYYVFQDERVGDKKYVKYKNQENKVKETAT